MVVTLGQQHNVGEKPTFLKKKMNASKFSEHPLTGRRVVKTFIILLVLIVGNIDSQGQKLFVGFSRVMFLDGSCIK